MLDCLICNRPEPSRRYNPGENEFVCSSCTIVLIGYRQADLIKIKEKSIGKGNEKKARGIGFFIGQPGKYDDEKVKRKKPIKIRASKRTKTVMDSHRSLSTL